MFFRFFELPAQAVRCTLFGISQPGYQKIPPQQRNSARYGGSRLPMKYPNEVRQFLSPLHGKEVMVFAMDWLYGETGFVKGSRGKELAAFSVL